MWGLGIRDMGLWNWREVGVRGMDLWKWGEWELGA